jgi:hypothetical protein
MKKNTIVRAIALLGVVAIALSALLPALGSLGS